jgi:hypothetical protein
MNIKELKEKIKDLPDDMGIVMSKDSEGNYFSPLYESENGNIYIPDTAYSGDVYPESWTAEDACMDEEEWQEILKKPRCVVLWPAD